MRTPDPQELIRWAFAVAVTIILLGVAIRYVLWGETL